MVKEISVRKRLPRDSLWILGVVCSLYAGLSVYTRGFGVDAHAYWLAWRGPMYTVAPGVPDAYLYSPAFAQLLWPLALLPWPLFAALIIASIALLLAWLLKPLGWFYSIPLWMAGLPEIVSGNVFIIMAFTVVIGFAYPGAWAFSALTKISPTVGPLWFLVRRQWSSLAQAGIVTGAVITVSYLSAPDLWRQWFIFLSDHMAASSAPLGAALLPPLVIRFPIGLGVVVYAACKDQRWLLPVGMLLCTPVLWLGGFTLLAAIPRLRLSQGLPPLPVFKTGADTQPAGNQIP